MAEHKHIDQATGTETVGHEWDGIEELDTPMPRWWLWTFYATIVWAAVYVILYPAWPLVTRATDGVLGWSSRGELEREIAARDSQLAPVRPAIRTSMTTTGCGAETCARSNSPSPMESATRITTRRAAR